MRYTFRMVELIIPRTCCGTVDAALFVVQGLSDMSATIPRTIRPNIPGIFCVIIALYFLGSVGYALFHSRDYASELPQFLRYVAAPGIIGISFLACALFASRQTSAIVSSMGFAILGDRQSVGVGKSVSLRVGFGGCR